MRLDMVDQVKAVKIKVFIEETKDKLEVVETLGKSFKRWLVGANLKIGKDKVTYLSLESQQSHFIYVCACRLT